MTPLPTPLHVPLMGRTLAGLPTLQVLRLLFLSLSAVWDHTKYHATTTIHKQLTSFDAKLADHKFSEFYWGCHPDQYPAESNSSHVQLIIE